MRHYMQGPNLGVNARPRISSAMTSVSGEQAAGCCRVTPLVPHPSIPRLVSDCWRVRKFHRANPSRRVMRGMVLASFSISPMIGHRLRATHACFAPHLWHSPPPPTERASIRPKPLSSDVEHNKTFITGFWIRIFRCQGERPKMFKVFSFRSTTGPPK